jgi:hypothetical protein
LTSPTSPHVSQSHSGSILDVQLDQVRAEIIQTQARAIATLLITNGATWAFHPQSVVEAVTSQDLSLLIPQKKENA